MADGSSILTKETLVPIGLVTGALGLIVTMSIYATNVTADVRNLKEQNANYQLRLSTVEGRVTSISTDQSVLTTKLDYIAKSIEAITRKLNVSP